MLNLHRVILSLLLTVWAASMSFAQFEFEFAAVLATQGTIHGGMAFDGENWYLTQSFTNNTLIYSNGFEQFIGNALTPFEGLDVISSRGITYVPGDDVFFIADNTANIAREVAVPNRPEVPDNDDFDLLSFHSLFSVAGFSIAPVTGSVTRGMAYDEGTDTLWCAGGDRIDQRQRQSDPDGTFSQGELVSSFVPEFPPELATVDGLNGIEFNPADQTLFAVTIFPSAVVEYALDGTLIGTVITTEQLSGFGALLIPAGVAYDSVIGRMYVLLDQGLVVVFDDPSRAALLLGDVNQDGVVDLLDVAPFVDLILNGGSQAEADINQDGVVDLLDVAGFVALILG